MFYKKQELLTIRGSLSSPLNVWWESCSLCCSCFWHCPIIIGFFAFVVFCFLFFVFFLSVWGFLGGNFLSFMKYHMSTKLKLMLNLIMEAFMSETAPRENKPMSLSHEPTSSLVVGIATSCDTGSYKRLVLIQILVPTHYM